MSSSFLGTCAPSILVPALSLLLCYDFSSPAFLLTCSFLTEMSLLIPLQHLQIPAFLLVLWMLCGFHVLHPGSQWLSKAGSWKHCVRLLYLYTYDFMNGGSRISPFHSFCSWLNFVCKCIMWYLSVYMHSEILIIIKQLVCYLLHIHYFHSWCFLSKYKAVPLFK